MSNILKADLYLQTSTINTEQVIDRKISNDLTDLNLRREYILKQAVKKAQNIENEAMKRAKELVEDAFEKSHSIITEAEREGYEKGYSQGLIDGARSANEDALAGLDEIGSLIELIKRQQREALHREEKNLLAIALEMTKKILKREAQIDKSLIAKMLEDIIAENQGSVKIYLSEYNKALDLIIDEAIIDKLRNESKNVKVVIVSQEDVIMAETDNGMVDMSISQQLKQLKAVCDGD